MTESNERSSLFRTARPPRIRLSELRQLVVLLETPDCNMAHFGQEISKHPGVVKQLLRAANSSLTGSANGIRDPGHATLYLGSRRVIFLLNTLSPDLIEDDSAREEDAA